MKKCLVCEKTIQDNDVVTVLVLAKYHPDKEEGHYQLEAFNQTLLSHKSCPEASTSV